VQGTTGHKNSSGFLILWAVMTGLWTLATILRVNRVWVPLEGWQSVVEGPWIWISLILPPAMFAVILAAIHQLNTPGRK